MVTALRLGREALDGGRLIFAADFADGSQGVFAYTLPAASDGSGPGSKGSGTAASRGTAPTAPP